ncbi:hypothetical protein [Arthrobacter sp.]|uniref:hypothetical protein n=1 Tax=Arthrobacter sp. TaxID=1667 RepID=UPI00339613E3
MAKFENHNLVLEDGETLQFPVPNDSPIRGCQRMRPIRTLDDIRNFGFVREWMRGFSTPRESPDALVTRLEAGELAEKYIYTGERFSSNEMLRFVRDISGGVVMELQLADFIVPAGATVVLSSPLAEIQANTVVIAGQLKFTDDLAIQCNEIRGS